MFNKTRLERIFKYLVEDEQHIKRLDIEVMTLKADIYDLNERIKALEEDNEDLHRWLDILKKRFKDEDDFSGYLHGCVNDNYDLINGLRDRIIKLEERKCHCEVHND